MFLEASAKGQLASVSKSTADRMTDIVEDGSFIEVFSTILQAMVKMHKPTNNKLYENKFGVVKLHLK